MFYSQKSDSLEYSLEQKISIQIMCVCVCVCVKSVMCMCVKSFL